MGLLAGILLALLFAGPASADIWVWRDSSGVSHYTNEPARIPAEYRDRAHAVARAWERPPLPKEEPEAEDSERTETATKPEQPPARELVELTGKLDSAYEAGFEAGRRSSGERSTPPATTPVVSQTQSQNVQILNAPEPRRERPLPFVGTIHGLVPGGPASRAGRFERNDDAPFAHTAAGPPPVGAAGR